MLEALNQEISSIVDEALPSIVVVEADFPVANKDGTAFTATGTGIVISEKHIVTSCSLIKGKHNYRIITHDKKIREASVVGLDHLRRIAILEVTPGDLNPIPSGDVNKLRPGNYLVIIGNSPDILVASTVGTFNGFEEYQGKLKILVNLTPGFSGGAVVNISGELVGILTEKSPEFIGIGASSFKDMGKAARSGSRGSQLTASDKQNFQFKLPSPNAVSAKPVDEVLAVLEQIRETGEIKYGFLGISSREVKKSIPNVVSTRLLKVINVANDSPAEIAGIKPDDYVILYDGKDITRYNQLYYYVKTTPPGGTAVITILRDDSLRTVEVEIGEAIQGLPVAEMPQLSIISRLGAQGAVSPPDPDAVKNRAYDKARREEIDARIEELKTQMREIQTELKRLTEDME